MKPSSRPGTPSKLSDSVHHQINMFALAASAAGVGALALAQPAEAEIVYTKTYHVIRTYEVYKLDLNHDHHTDFVITNSGTRCGTDLCFRSLGITPAAGNGVTGVTSSGDRYLAFALDAGARVDSKNLLHAGAGMAEVVEPPRSSCLWGYWCNVTNRYLGLQFKIRGQTHYGWARLDVKVDRTTLVPTVATLTGYAYETVPNKPIIAGKTKGADLDPAQPATLGSLAIGRR